MAKLKNKIIKEASRWKTFMLDNALDWEVEDRAFDSWTEIMTKTLTTNNKGAKLFYLEHLKIIREVFTRVSFYKDKLLKSERDYNNLYDKYSEQVSANIELQDRLLKLEQDKL